MAFARNRSLQSLIAISGAGVALLLLGVSGMNRGTNAPSRGSNSLGGFDFASIAIEGVDVLTTPVNGTVIVSTTGDIGKIVLILERRSVDGSEWIRIENGWPANTATFGWIPAESKEMVNGSLHDVSTLDLVRPPCSRFGTRDPASISDLPQAVRLACSGNREIRLSPVIVRREPAAEPVVGVPAWLATSDGLDIYGEHSLENADMPLEIHISPSLGPEIPIDTWIEVAGHFDDPAARECRRSASAPQYPVGDVNDQILWCRQQFVVTAFADVPSPSSAPSPTTPTLTGTWTAIPPAPIQGRQGHAAVWTGNEMVIWGGQPGPSSADDHRLSTGQEGAAFNPTDGTWRPLRRSPLMPRTSPLATWSGTDVLIWGGWNNSPYTRLKDGAAYNPVSNTWRPLPAAPLGGLGLSTGAWTGNEWLVVDGIDSAVDSTASMAAFDPKANTWKLGPSLEVPASRSAMAVWANQALVLLVQPNTGPAVAWSYRPSTGWVSLPAPPVGAGMIGGQGIWSGTEVLVPAIGAPLTGGQVGDQIIEFDPTTALWQRAARPPAGLIPLEPVWNGRLALFYAGGRRPAGAFDPALNRWFDLPPRLDHHLDEATAIWAGDRLIAWGGGQGESGFLPNDGVGFAFSSTSLAP